MTADARLFEWLLARRPAALEPAIRVCASSGRGAIVPLAVATAVRLTGRPLPLRRCAATTLGVYAGSLTLARVVRRRRPYETRDVRVLVARPVGPSLPSDQVAAAFAAARFVAGAAPEYRAGIYLAAAAIGAARVLAGVHYPGDVVVAATLGTAVAGRFHPSRSGDPSGTTTARR